jgi:hypothetical protein
MAIFNRAIGRPPSGHPSSRNERTDAVERRVHATAVVDKFDGGLEAGAA